MCTKGSPGHGLLACGRGRQPAGTNSVRSVTHKTGLCFHSPSLLLAHHLPEQEFPPYHPTRCLEWSQREEMEAGLQVEVHAGKAAECRAYDVRPHKLSLSPWPPRLFPIVLT